MITLKDKLSHLTYRQACKLLGPNGDQLIRSGGKYDIDIYEQVVLKKERFQLNLNGASVSIRLDPAKDQRFNIQCSQCSNFCEHMGAAFSLILEEKL